MSRHYAPHQAQTADPDVMLHTRKAAASAGLQREIAPLSPTDLNLTQLPRARLQSSAIALSRVAGNRATAQLVQRCESCGGKDDDSVQRSFFDDMAGGAQNAVNSANNAAEPGQSVAGNSGGGGMLGGIADSAQNAVNSANNAAQPGQSMMDDSVGAAQNAAASASNTVGNLFDNLF